MFAYGCEFRNTGYVSKINFDLKTTLDILNYYSIMDWKYWNSYKYKIKEKCVVFNY